MTENASSPTLIVATLSDPTLSATLRKRKNSITASLEDSLRRQRIRSESPTPNKQTALFQMADEDQPMNNAQNRNPVSNNPPPRIAPQIVSEVNGVTTLDNDGGVRLEKHHGSEPVALRAEKGPKIWTRIYRGSARDDLQAVAAKIVAAARKLTGDDRINIIAPIEKAPLDERSPAPYNYLLVDGDEAAMSFLTATSLCATPDVQFFAEPFDIPRPSYIGTLEGFACQDSPDSNTAIATAVSRHLMALQHIVDYLVQHAKPHSGQSAADVAADVLNSVTIYSLRMARNKTTFIQFGTCMLIRQTCPLISGWDDAQWCETLRSKFTALDADGFARATRSSNALGCKSNDHPTGLCSIPAIPGWFGVSLATVAADDKTFSDLDDGYHPPPPSSAPSSSKGRGRGAYRRNDNARSGRTGTGGRRPY
ncbi:hypothetical protein B0H14DRAFT_3446904 [Mycena olivaceomarginata]|nr:hypothetical protein B0H14DRAFT_3446904 [Mycena olivaceomarginata]